MFKIRVCWSLVLNKLQLKMITINSILEENRNTHQQSSKTIVKSMRNGQTAAIGPPKASSYLARGWKEGRRGISCGGRDIWLIERPYSTEAMEWSHVHLH